MAAAALTAYRGHCVVFVGEWNLRTAASEAFFAALEADWDLELVYEHPRWFGMKDQTSVWQRRGQVRAAM